MTGVNENAAKPGKLPERCSKAVFARLLQVDAALVSRWVASDRIELDDAGRVLVRPSLTKLLLTTDPSRGGRGAVRGEGSGTSTIDRARQLLQSDGDDQASKTARLSEKLADALAQLELERKFREENCYHKDDEASLRFQLIDAMREQWAELSAALEADALNPAGEAFDRLMFRIECRIYNGESAEQIAESEAWAFDGIAPSS